MDQRATPEGPGWSSGLCACCVGQNPNPGFFCTSLCCGFVAQGVLLQDAGLVKSWAYPTIAYGLMDAFTGGALTLLAFVSLRSNMGAALHRKEGICTTYLTSMCCYPCAMSQVHRDIYDRGYCFKTNDSMVNSIVGVIEDPKSLSYMH
jgi:Cys-rich protein (TIGR01571 family)